MWCARRAAPTNQRLRFDVTSDGRHLCTPSHDGRVLLYRIDDGAPLDAAAADAAVSSPVLAAVGSVGGFEQCVNSLSCHPLASALIAVGTGEREALTLANGNDNDNAASGDDDDSNNASSDDVPSRRRRAASERRPSPKPAAVVPRNSLSVWHAATLAAAPTAPTTQLETQ